MKEKTQWQDKLTNNNYGDYDDGDNYDDDDDGDNDRCKGDTVLFVLLIVRC